MKLEGCRVGFSQVHNSLSKTCLSVCLSLLTHVSHGLTAASPKRLPAVCPYFPQLNSSTKTIEFSEHQGSVFFFFPRYNHKLLRIPSLLCTRQASRCQRPGIEARNTTFLEGQLIKKMATNVSKYPSYQGLDARFF